MKFPFESPSNLQQKIQLMIHWTHSLPNVLITAVMFTASYEWLNYARKSKASLSTPNKLSKKTRKLKTSLRNYLHYSFIFYFHSFEKWIKWNWQEDKERNGQKKHGLSPSHHTLYTFCRKDVHWWVLVIYILWVFFDLQNYIRYIYINSTFINYIFDNILILKNLYTTCTT